MRVRIRKEAARTCFEISTILIILSALFGLVNHRIFRLPATIGVMAIALVISLGFIALDIQCSGIGRERAGHALRMRVRTCRGPRRGDLLPGKRSIDSGGEGESWH